MSSSKRPSRPRSETPPARRDHELRSATDCEFLASTLPDPRSPSPAAITSFGKDHRQIHRHLPRLAATPLWPREDRASEIFKTVDSQKAMKGRNQYGIMAACLYIACRQEDKPRTVKEIATIANGASRKDIGRAKEFIVKNFEDEMTLSMGTIHAGDFLRRFGSHLSMNNKEIIAAQEVVQKAEELDIRQHFEEKMTHMNE